ncbi:MAG: glycosyltransferase [Candidatus Marinimicrobia bacterium]|nr:glycosyltransferase [Candidatus Neomarinimicrobiota bacterium]
MPSVLLLISAYNEEKIIREKIDNSLCIEYENLQIVIASDGSTDNTEKICREFEPEIRLIHFDKNEGKNATLNKILSNISSDIVVFTDANTMYKKNTIKKLVGGFSDPKVGCIGGHLMLTQTKDSNTSQGEGLYWCYENMLKQMESDLGELLSTNGGIFAARKKIIEKLEEDVPNDFQIPMNIGAKGYKVIYNSDAIAIEKTSTNFIEEMKRKIRIVNRTFTGFLKFKDSIKGLRLFELISHKLIRWFIGIFALLLLLISIALVNQPLYFWILIAQIIFYFLAFVGFIFHSESNIIYIPFYITIIFIASTIGVLKALTGEKYKKWSPPNTSR